MLAYSASHPAGGKTACSTAAVNISTFEVLDYTCISRLVETQLIHNEGNGLLQCLNFDLHIPYAEFCLIMAYKWSMAGDSEKTFEHSVLPCWKNLLQCATNCQLPSAKCEVPC